ncbi:hypothetical protein HDV02_005115 [Globomyces sp. JEL0801]|nr:hypothetical protein HDV02_005115 [Globomyces sp. JEL0801]
MNEDFDPSKLSPSKTIRKRNKKTPDISTKKPDDHSMIEPPLTPRVPVSLPLIEVTNKKQNKSKKASTEQISPISNQLLSIDDGTASQWKLNRSGTTILPSLDKKKSNVDNADDPNNLESIIPVLWIRTQSGKQELDRISSKASPAADIHPPKRKKKARHSSLYKLKDLKPSTVDLESKNEKIVVQDSTLMSVAAGVRITLESYVPETPVDPVEDITAPILSIAPPKDLGAKIELETVAVVKKRPPKKAKRRFLSQHGSVPDGE